MTDAPASDAQLEALRKYDTPTICNALEIVAPKRRAIGFTVANMVCADPALAPVVGYARTATIRSMRPPPAGTDQRRLRVDYYTHIDSGGPRPSVIVIQDLDEIPGFGAFWGEVNSNIHKGLGCDGLVTDGSVRDLDVIAPGFQMLAAKVVPSHAHAQLVAFAGDVEVCGMAVSDGDLVHMDRHGAVVVPHGAVAELPAACELLMRREKVILDAAKSPGFNAEILARAMGQADDVH